MNENVVIQSIDCKYLDSLLSIDARSHNHSWTRANLCSSYEQFDNLGVFLDNKLIAFVFYQTADVEVEIIYIVCDQEHQGKGYIFNLLKYLKNQSKNQGIKKIFLEVRDSNQRAIHVYRQLNFATVGQRQHYYKNKENALIMVCSLD